MDAVVLRHDELSAPVQAKFAHNGGVGALQNLDDLAIGASAGFDARDSHQDAVAVHGLLRRFGWNENVALDAFNGAVGNEEAIAVAMHVEPSGGEFAAAGGNDELSRAQFDELAAFGEAFERGFQVLARGALGACLTHELFEVRAGVGKTRDVVDQRPVGHTTILRSTPGVAAPSDNRRCVN